MRSSILFLTFIIDAMVCSAQSTAGLTHIPDTSFTIQSEFRKNIKNYPNIRIVPELRSDNVKEKRNIDYGKAGDKKLYLDAFYPRKDDNDHRTALIFLYGGGWRSGDRSLHYPLVQRLAALGYVCFTPEYRLSTEALYPAAVYDIKAAVRWVRKNAAKYHVDPQHIVIGGHSAGGELAAFIASTNGDTAYEGRNGNGGYSSQVNGLIDVDGILAFVHSESGEGDDSRKTSSATYWFGYSKEENAALWKQASPLSHVKANAVPTLFLNSSVARMHAGRDDYIEMLQKFQVYSEVKTFENAPHSFCFFEPWFDEMLGYMDRFMKKIFSDHK